MALTQVKTNAIADDAVTLAKQAGGTDGQIITYDASGDPVAVGPGTDGQVLTSTGAGSPPAFETLPASGAALTGSTNNTITTVTGANAIQGEANLTFDGTKLIVDSDNTYGNIVVSRDGGVGGRRPFGIGISGSADDHLRISASNDTSSANAFTNALVEIDASGNVGIGTATPSSIFHCQRSGGAEFRFDDNYFWIKAPDGGNRYFFGETGNSASAQLSLYNSADSQKVRIAAGDGANDGDSFFNGGRTFFGNSASITTWGSGARLQVHGTDHAGASRSQVRWSNDTASSSLMLCKSRSGTPGSYTAVQTDDNIGNIAWLGDDGTDLNESVARIDAYVDGTVAGNQVPGRLEFSTTKTNGQSSQKMYIRAGGEIDIADKIRIGSFTGDYDQALINLYSDSTKSRIECSAANTVSTHINFRYTTTTHGSISHTQTATSYNTSSDYRLKENQVAISDGITRLKTLKPYRFNFKATPDQTVDGFFAHEVTAVPEATIGTKDAMAPETFYEEGDTLPSGKKVGDVKTYSSSEIEPQQIDQAKLVPLLTAALQEAITKIETLETKVAALESA